MALALEDIITDPKYKELFDAVALNAINKAGDGRTLQAMFAQGMRGLTPTDGLFSKFTWALQTSENGSNALPTATGDLTYAAPQKADVARASMGMSLQFGISNLTYEQMKHAQAGDAGRFVDEVADALIAPNEVVGHSILSQFLNEGYGEVAQLDTGTSVVVINAGASGTIKIKNRHHVRPNMIVQPVNAGTPVADVFLRVTSAGSGTGSGDITVTNLGSANYTPAADHTLDAYNPQAGSKEYFYMGGLRNITDSAVSYPEAVGVNVALDDPLYRPLMQTANTSSALTLGDFEFFASQMRGLITEDFNANHVTEIGGIGYDSPATVFMMHPYMLLNFKRDLRQNNANQRFYDYQEAHSPLWGNIVKIAGVTIVENYAMPLDIVYCLYLPGLRGNLILDDKLPGQNAMGFDLKSGSNQYYHTTASWFTIVGFDRQHQGSLRGYEAAGPSTFNVAP